MEYKYLFQIIGAIFLIYFFTKLVWSYGLKGALFSLFIVAVGIIGGLGERYNYDGDLYAILFAAIVLISHYMYQKYIKRKSFNNKDKKEEIN